VNRFNPNWRGITFKKEEEVDLKNFDVYIKNAARKEAGNDIYKARGGDNYAIDLYFAQADLAKNPRAIRSEAFPATVTRGDLSVALAALDQTSKLYAKALVTLPLRNCERFVWLCACVREGSAAKYLDSDRNNNCECKDVSPQAQCQGRYILCQLLVIRMGIHDLHQWKKGATVESFEVDIFIC
jgi:hypothetical protein